MICLWSYIVIFLLKIAMHRKMLWGNTNRIFAWILLFTCKIKYKKVEMKNIGDFFYIYTYFCINKDIISSEKYKLFLI